MDSITLHNVLPEVFSGRNLQSDVWQEDVRIDRGDVCLIEADSGTGKSSLCSFIIGYRNDYTGQICFSGKDIRGYGVREWTAVRQRHISHMFQELRLFPELTALENVEIKNNIVRHKTRKQIEPMFEALGIADKMNSKAGLMSFGQQQRVALIRALVQPFDFLFADEPISHLDDKNSRIMGELVMEEARAQGAGVVTTSIGRHMELPYNKTLML